MPNLQKPGKYAECRKRDRILRTAVAAVVLFCTIFSWILPTIAMESESSSCGLEAHSHEEACYRLICEKQEIFSHTHTEECYGEDEELICTLEERTLHHHTDSCYSHAEPICGQKESQAHVHTGDCYGMQTVLTCLLEEGEAHTHSDACYLPQPVLICGVEETQGHTHTEGCYPADFEPERICGKEDIPEHRHDEECYLRICGMEAHAHTDACLDSQETFIENPEQPNEAEIDWTDPVAAEAEQEPLCGLEEDENHVHSENCYAAADDRNDAASEDEPEDAPDAGMIPAEEQTAAEDGEEPSATQEDISDSITIEMEGEIATEKPGFIKWTVTVNGNQQNLVGATLTDEMLLPGKNATDITVSHADGVEFNSAEGKHTFAAVGDTGVNENQYTITYFTPVEQTWDGSTVSNRAILDPDPSTPGDEEEAIAEVVVSGVQLDITGSHSAAADQLDWIIDVNSGNLDIAGATLTDTMFSGLEESAFAVTPIDGYAFIRDDDHKITGIQFCAVTEDGRNTQCYTIAYSTAIAENGGAQETAVTNTAVLSPKDGVDGQPITAQNTIDLERAGLSLDGEYNHQKLHWTVTVNGNGKNIAAAVLTDGMLGRLTPEEIKVQNGRNADVPADSGEYTINTDENGCIRSITFNAIGETGVNTNPYILSYSTNQLPEWSEKTVTNEAKLSLPEGDVASSKDITIPGTGEVVRSAGQGTVDGSIRTIPWTVTLIVPPGGLAVGTSITEDAANNPLSNSDANQWITISQAEAFQSAGMIWTDQDGNQKGTVALSDKITFTGEETVGEETVYQGFTITFREALMPPDGATKLTFTYFTTADRTDAGTLTVSNPVEGTLYHLYRVGSLQNGEIVLNREFQRVDISDDAAASVMADMIRRAGVGQEEASAVVSDGKAVFTGLPMAVYLVLGDPEERDGVTHRPVPLLCSIPQRDEAGASIWEVSVNGETETEMDISVVNRWVGDLVIYRPTSVTVRLMRDGKTYGDPVVLNYVNQWSHTWENLPQADWSVTANVSSRYTTATTREGNTFIVTNTWKKIPQTGQLWWPVPVLTVAGLGFLCIGLLRRRKGDRNG